MAEQLIQSQIYYQQRSLLMTQPDPHEQLLVIEDKCLITGKVTKYVKAGFLGKGGFARCYQFVRQDTKDVCAIKIIQKANLVKPRSKQKLHSEIKIHESLHHANIVDFRHTFEDNLNVYIVLELCTNQTLNDLLKRKKKLSQSEIQYYMLQLVEALIYLHQQKVIHRDLKLGNLFLSDKMTVRLGDFGLASKLDFPGEKRRTICGTPNYIAPQILDSRGHSYQVDIWSFGIILYTLAFGRPPFQSKDVKQTYKKIKLNLFSFPQNTANFHCLKSLITTILQKDPARRPSLREVRDHDFFQGATLSRQPSLRSQISVANLNRTSSYKESQRELSDNGKLYTNNDIGSSKDAIMKSQDRFTNTERNPSCIKTPLKQQNIQRIRSQRILKEVTREKENECVPQIAVRKWIDYSNKYGIGYLLSNRSYGVYFNDSTKMVAQTQEYFFYLERVNKQDVLKKYRFSDYPSDLKKKVGLFNHFKGYLKDEENKSQMVPIDPKNLVYIKRWFRSKHSVIFRMSNKTVQVIFIDQTQLIINSTTKKVAYFNKGHERFQYPIQEIMDSNNKQLIKRFQYTKQVLNQMAKAHQSKKQQQVKGNTRDKSCDKDNFSNTLYTPVKLASTQSQMRIGRFNETSSPFK